MKINDIVYLGIRLDNNTRSALIRRFLKEFKDRLTNFGRIYCDHITIQYGNIDLNWLLQVGKTKKLKIGKTFVVIEDGNLVYLPVDVGGVEFAHITIASNGMVSPIKSKEHLQTHPYLGDFVESNYKGTLCAYLKDGAIIDNING